MLRNDVIYMEFSCLFRYFKIVLILQEGFSMCLWEIFSTTYAFNIHNCSTSCYWYWRVIWNKDCSKSAENFEFNFFVCDFRLSFFLFSRKINLLRETAVGIMHNQDTLIVEITLWHIFIHKYKYIVEKYWEIIVLFQLLGTLVALWKLKV